MKKKKELFDFKGFENEAIEKLKKGTPLEVFVDLPDSGEENALSGNVLDALLAESTPCCACIVEGKNEKVRMNRVPGKNTVGIAFFAIQVSVFLLFNLFMICLAVILFSSSCQREKAS